MNSLKSFFRFIFGLKWKIVFLFISTLTFIFLIFPTNEVSDLVGGQLSKLTNGAVYLEFGDVSIGLFPPSVKLTKPIVETQAFPKLKVDELTASPSIIALIQRQPGGAVQVKGIFKGDIDLDISKGTKSEAGIEKKKVNLKVSQVSIDELAKLFSLPVTIQGKLNSEALAQVDLTFSEQPDVDLQMQIQNLIIPSSSFETQMGPLQFSGIKLSRINLKGRMAGGKVIIEEGKIGEGSDEIVGNIKGSLDVKFANIGGNISPVLGGYDLEIQLNIKKTFQERETLLLTLFDGYKQPLDATSDQFKIKVSASSMAGPPSISALK